MATERDYRDTFSRDKIRSLMASGFQTAYVRDVAGRVQELYESPIGTEAGQPCLKTEFKYIDGAAGTSRSVVATRESVVAWPTYEVVQVGAGNDFTALI